MPFPPQRARRARCSLKPGTEPHLERMGEELVTRVEADAVVEPPCEPGPEIEAIALLAAFAAVRGGESGEQRYRLDLRPGLAGRLDYRIRLYPRNELLTHPFEMGLSTWL